MDKQERIRLIMQVENEIVLACIKGDFKLVGNIENKLRDLLEDLL